MKARRSLLVKASSAVRKSIETFPRIKQIMSHPLGERLIKDMEFRTGMLLRAGFVVNLLYCVLQVILGIFYRSLWAGALAVFHLLLASMRFQLLKVRNGRRENQNIAAQWKKYRFCGITLLCMTPFFASILILVVHKNGGGKYLGPVIYLMAIYTFVTVILAANSVVKFRKCHKPILSAAKVINLTKALVSMLSLETAILTRYDRMDTPIFRQGLMGTAGGAVCLFVMGVAVYMSVHGTKQLKLLHNE